MDGTATWLYNDTFCFCYGKRRFEGSGSGLGYDGQASVQHRAWEL